MSELVTCLSLFKSKDEAVKRATTAIRALEVMARIPNNNKYLSKEKYRD